MKKNEKIVLQEIRLIAPSLGVTLWRNNTGATYAPDGRLVRYGLANDSYRMNQNIKSSDLIGLTSTGRFIAIEAKKEGWVFTGTLKELAQERFLEIVRKNGGYGFFINDVSLLKKYLGF